MENTTPTAITSDVTIADLFLIKDILDVAIQRGAFRGDELVTVGQTYTKLVGFLNQVSGQATNTDETPAEPNQGE